MELQFKKLLNLQAADLLMLRMVVLFDVQFNRRSHKAAWVAHAWWSGSVQFKEAGTKGSEEEDVFDIQKVKRVSKGSRPSTTFNFDYLFSTYKCICPRSHHASYRPRAGVGKGFAVSVAASHEPLALYHFVKQAVPLA
jgi:hypothetical protein